MTNAKCLFRAGVGILMARLRSESGSEQLSRSGCLLARGRGRRDGTDFPGEAIVVQRVMAVGGSSNLVNQAGFEALTENLAAGMTAGFSVVGHIHPIRLVCSFRQTTSDLRSTMSNTLSATDAARARLQRLEGFIEQDPDNVNLLADAAECALLLDDLPRARAHLQRALELVPGSAPLRLQLSSVAIAEGNFDDSLALTTALLDGGVDEAAVRFNHAFALVSLQRHEEALPMLVRLHVESLPYPMVVRLLIRCHHYLGDLDEAIAVADAHLAAHADDADVAGMLALLHFDNEDFAAARAWGTRALAGSPGNLDALLAVGMVALSSEEVDTGKSLLKQAVSADPRNGRAWAGLGLAEMMTFDLPAAERMFGQAVKNMPAHIGSWHMLGWVQLLQGQVDAAEANFKTALDIDDTFGESHGALAAVAATRGEWDKAERLTEVARRLDPDAMSVRYVDLLKAHRDAPMDPAVTQRFLRHVLQATRAPGGTGTLADMAERMSVRSGMKRSDSQTGL